MPFFILEQVNKIGKKLFICLLRSNEVFGTIIQSYLLLLHIALITLYNNSIDSILGIVTLKY